MGLLVLRGSLPAEGVFDPRWVYGLSVLIVGGALLWFWKEYGELARQNLPDLRQTLWSLGVGLAVFGLWIHLDAPWMQLGEATANFVPLDAQGRIDWTLIAMRWIGARER